MNDDRKSQILLGTVKAVSANHNTEVLDFGGAAGSRHSQPKVYDLDNAASPSQGIELRHYDTQQ